MESACCRGRVLGLGVDNALSENILFHMNEAAKRDTEHSWIQFKNFCKLPWTQHFGSYTIASISVFQIILNIWYQNRCSWRNWSVLNYKNKQKHAVALIFYKGSKFFPTFVTRFLISLEQEQFWWRTSTTLCQQNVPALINWENK